MCSGGAEGCLTRYSICEIKWDVTLHTQHSEPNWRTTVSDTLVNEALRGQAKALRELDDLQEQHARLVAVTQQLADYPINQASKYAKVPRAMINALRAELEKTDARPE